MRVNPRHLIEVSLPLRQTHSCCACESSIDSSLESLPAPRHQKQRQHSALRSAPCRRCVARAPTLCSGCALLCHHLTPRPRHAYGFSVREARGLRQKKVGGPRQLCPNCPRTASRRSYALHVLRTAGYHLVECRKLAGHCGGGCEPPTLCHRCAVSLHALLGRRRCRCRADGGRDACILEAAHYEQQLRYFAPAAQERQGEAVVEAVPCALRAA